MIAAEPTSIEEMVVSNCIEFSTFPLLLYNVDALSV